MKFIRKSKVMEYLNIGESSMKQLIYSKKLIPYHRKGTEAFFKTKDVYRIIESRKSDVEFIKSMPIPTIMEERKLKNHQEKFYYYTIIEVLSRTIGKSKVFQSDRKNEIVEDVIINSGDFTYVAEKYYLNRNRILTIFRDAMKIHLSRFDKVSESLELNIKYQKLQDDYQALISMNKELIDEVEKLSSIKKMDAESNLAIMSIEICDIPLSVRAFNTLNNAGVKTLYDLSKISIHELKRYRNTGLKTVLEIEEAAKSYGITLKEVPSLL